MLTDPVMLQMQCKLFVFDKTSQSWVERGRGLLRLNDMAATDDGTLQSRLGELWGRTDLPIGRHRSRQNRKCGLHSWGRGMAENRDSSAPCEPWASCPSGLAS